MPLSYTWHLPTFFLSRHKTCESQSSSATSNQIGLIEQFLALVSNRYTIAIRSPLSFGIRFGIRWYFFWYTFMFSIDSLVYGRYTAGIRSVYGRYTVGIRLVYGAFPFSTIFCHLIVCKTQFAWVQKSSHIAGAPLQDVLKNWTSSYKWKWRRTYMST